MTVGLPWVRLDSNIAGHDKVLRLIAMKDGYRAAAVMMFAFGWSGAHGTDGFIPSYALTQIHATHRQAAALVDVGAWEPTEGGWQIRNWDTRQELVVVSDAKRHAQRVAGLKGACLRYHGPDCGCWKVAADGTA